ncbi:MAG: PEGA domain-containing protein [Methanoregula sp.]|uniref:PEGA domain-containing protein n=1 Tax=Methanoregula sp. TaxID=2052170 RepID=UPI003C3411C0
MKRMFLLLFLFSMILLLPAGVSADGNISVTSTPGGATIYLDGAGTGITTSAVIDAASGSHTILLRLSGYQDYSQAVTVIDNQTSVVSASLTAVVSAPTISGISPTSGYNSSIITITITGTGFSASPSVVLAQSGQTNITATSVSVTGTTSISCQFPLTGKPAGVWTVIVTNPDGQSATSGFTINNAGSTITLSSVTPNSGLVNTTISITSLSGTNFLNTATMKLSRTGYNDIPGTITSYSATQLTGTFNLNSQTPGTYQICVSNDAATYVCGLSFVINTPGTVNGTLYVQSSPSGASVYVDSVNLGKTATTLYNVTPGSHTINLLLSGYSTWSDTVTVTSGNTTYEYATLKAVATDVTSATTVPTTTPKTVGTTKQSTYTPITPWPTNTPAKSPEEPFVVIGAVGVGILILRKNY